MLRQFLDLWPGQILITEHAIRCPCDAQEGGLEAMSVQNRHGGQDILPAVIEGQHHRVLRRGPLAV
jgi:hypothetical protein